MLLRDTKQCCGCVWNDFFVVVVVGEIEQKRPILCLKRKSLDINFFFLIEPLYKINITFVTMLIF